MCLCAFQFRGGCGPGPHMRIKSPSVYRHCPRDSRNHATPHTFISHLARVNDVETRASSRPATIYHTYTPERPYKSLSYLCCHLSHITQTLRTREWCRLNTRNAFSLNPNKYRRDMLLLNSEFLISLSYLRARH